MDENEKKENENVEQQTDETPKTDEQPKQDTTVTAKDKFAMYSVIFALFAFLFLIVVTVAPKISEAIEDYKIEKEVASEDYTDTTTSSSDDDTDYSSDDDTSTSSSFTDDYSALDYESQNCYDQAMSYLDFMAFSRNGLIHQLQYEGYTDNAISNALDLLEKYYVSWDTEAVKKAQEYMETFSFSQQRLYEQLIHDGFTEEQANYGVTYGYNNN